jgi:hypothetical protein
MIMPMKSKAGRNDPCPCGSGIKFRKCCMNKTVDASSPPHSPPKYKMMRAVHWSQDEIREMSTEQIIAQLKQWGIPFDEKEFLEDVKVSMGASDIYKKWEERFVITAEGLDEDFIWMACEVLWERLAKGKVSTEQIDDMMQEGYDLIKERDVIKGCELWLKVWEELKPRFTKDMKSVKDAESVFKGTQCLFNWCQDLELESYSAADKDKAFCERRIRYCREFCKLFPESDESILHGMKIAIAESLFMAGRLEESEKEFQTLADDYPDNPWAYINWGDMYSGIVDGIHNNERAEELYRMGLGRDERDDEVILERIEELKE